MQFKVIEPFPNEAPTSVGGLGVDPVVARSNSKASRYQSIEYSDRAALYGDGFFSTGLVEEQRVRHLELHIERLKSAAEILGFHSLDITELSDKLSRMAATQPNCIFRISCSREQKSRGYAVDDTANVLVTVILSPWQAEPTKNFSLSFSTIPVSINPYLAGIKHLNRLDNVLAANECRDSQHEVLMLNGDDVICGSRSNVFALINGKWQTPSLHDAGIEGITRQRVIRDAKQLGITINEATLSRENMINCDAAFITNSLIGMRPVERIGTQALSTDRVNKLKSDLGFCR